MNTLIKINNAATHEMITNSENAYRDGLITREERNDAIRAAIAAETENQMLTNYETKG